MKSELVFINIYRMTDIALSAVPVVCACNLHYNPMRYLIHTQSKDEETKA